MAESKPAIYAAMGGNLLIAITKFVAAAMTGSSAMLSEGIHSVVDTGNQVLLLLGLKRAKQPASAQFPFGHGKEVYFWSFVVALLIFAIGAGVSIYEGITHILAPEPMESPMINYIVLGLGILFEGASWAFALNQFRKTKGKWSYVQAVRRGKDPALFVVIFEDSAALLGLLTAMAGVALSQWTDNPIFDGIASVLIGLILGGTAIWLAIETKGLLIGESANPSVVESIRGLAGEAEGVERRQRSLDHAHGAGLRPGDSQRALRPRHPGRTHRALDRRARCPHQAATGVGQTGIRRGRGACRYRHTPQPWRRSGARLKCRPGGPCKRKRPARHKPSGALQRGSAAFR